MRFAKSRKASSPVVSESARSGRSEFLCRRGDQRGFVLQNTANDHNPFVSLLPLLLLDGLTNRRDGFCRVSRVVPGRVELVLEPGPIGQTLGGEQPSFTLNK